ncbi:hypothetical protein K435DRAFT_87685 [Dendrothele bispora CBS 962.96]|uniref:Uncharacterized protein n=1 Tax=Dendrothele bispora (strain CBS 962.96) TaxID=1314807 RepID=A0A4S8M4N9_DENBC|nr:hypothetical protein K435DRAFT_87685 [Dendrothele bispora CBS 962.96]
MPVPYGVARADIRLDSAADILVQSVSQFPLPILQSRTRTVPLSSLTDDGSATSRSTPATTITPLRLAFSISTSSLIVVVLAQAALVYSKTSDTSPVALPGPCNLNTLPSLLTHLLSPHTNLPPFYLSLTQTFCWLRTFTFFIILMSLTRLYLVLLATGA